MSLLARKGGSQQLAVFAAVHGQLLREYRHGIIVKARSSAIMSAICVSTCCCIFWQFFVVDLRAPRRRDDHVLWICCVVLLILTLNDGGYENIYILVRVAETMEQQQRLLNRWM
jgi:hypothetical protein